MSNPFEHATTADFEGSSARDERALASTPFDTWVQQYLETARIAYEASEGGVDPWVVLVRPGDDRDTRRLFTPDADETNRAFFSRITREARQMAATQVFVAMVSQSAHARGDDDLPSATDIQGREAEFSPLFEESILWYAEGPLRTRYGMIPVQLGRAGEVLENEDADHDGASPLFTAILR